MSRRIRVHIPSTREADPLSEYDRDEKKLDVFLSFHKHTLTLADMKVFLPFTINLDPFIKKVVKGAAGGAGVAMVDARNESGVTGAGLRCDSCSWRHCGINEGSY